MELATRLSPAQFQTRIFVLGSPPEPSFAAVLQLAQERGVAVRFLQAARPWHAVRTWRRLRSELLEFRPSVLQCYLAHANVAGAMAGSYANVPHILTGIRVAEGRSNWHNWLSRRTDRLVTRHVCVSESVAHYAAERMSLPREKLVVIPNGVDVNRFEAVVPWRLSELGLAADRRMLLFVGRLDEQKRPDWLLQRMPDLAQRLPDHDLVVAGQGPLQHRLQQLVEQLSLGGRIHLLGWRKDVPQLLAAAEMLLVTSAWEGMPGVVLEAMAAAKPVVATEVHGVAELLGPGTAEQVVPSEDGHQFVERVVRFASHHDYAQQVGRRNAVRAAEQFSIERMVHNYRTLYEHLLGGPTVHTATATSEPTRPATGR